MIISYRRVTIKIFKKSKLMKARIVVDFPIFFQNQCTNKIRNAFGKKMTQNYLQTKKQKKHQVDIKIRNARLQLR